jgi:hypothetical protein
MSAMSVEQRCPAFWQTSLQRPLHGIQIDSEGYSSVHQRDIRLRFTFTQVVATPDPAASCAFIQLEQQSQQALDALPFDKVSACRRCARTVRVQVGLK